MSLPYLNNIQEAFLGARERFISLATGIHLAK
jgi:hypothetical protein